MAIAKKKVVRKLSVALKAAPKAAARRKTGVKTSSSASKADRVAPYIYLGFGLLFGYLLTKAGLTDNNTILNMFLVFKKDLRDFHPWGVIGLLVAILTLGVFLLQRFKAKPLVGAEPFAWKPKPFEPALLVGSAVFGIGWALTGACPATAIAQVGEGKIVALATIAGILTGIWICKRFAEDK